MATSLVELLEEEAKKAVAEAAAKRLTFSYEGKVWLMKGAKESASFYDFVYWRSERMIKDTTLVKNLLRGDWVTFAEARKSEIERACPDAGGPEGWDGQRCNSGNVCAWWQRKKIDFVGL